MISSINFNEKEIRGCRIESRKFFAQFKRCSFDSKATSFHPLLPVSVSLLISRPFSTHFNRQRAPNEALNWLWRKFRPLDDFPWIFFLLFEISDSDDRFISKSGGSERYRISSNRSKQDFRDQQNAMNLTHDWYLLSKCSPCGGIWLSEGLFVWNLLVLSSYSKICDFSNGFARIVKKWENMRNMLKAF